MILPLVIPGTYRKARGSASDGQKVSDTFVDRVTVLYLLPDEHFAFFTFRQGYEKTMAVGQWVRREERVVLHGVAEAMGRGIPVGSSLPSRQHRHTALSAAPP